MGLGQSFPHKLSLGVELGMGVKSLPFLDSRSTLQLRLGVKGVLEWVRVPPWLGNGLVVCFYGLGYSFPHELAFEVELVLVVISLQFSNFHSSGLLCS